jgi:hypothetical protein
VGVNLCDQSVQADYSEAGYPERPVSSSVVTADEEAVIDRKIKGYVEFGGDKEEEEREMGWCEALKDPDEQGPAMNGWGHGSFGCRQSVSSISRASVTRAVVDWEQLWPFKDANNWNTRTNRAMRSATTRQVKHPR